MNDKYFYITIGLSTIVAFGAMYLYFSNKKPTVDESDDSSSVIF